MVKKPHNHTLYTIYPAKQYPKPISDFAKPCKKKVLVVEMYDAKKIAYFTLLSPNYLALIVILYVVQYCIPKKSKYYFLMYK